MRVMSTKARSRADNGHGDRPQQGTTTPRPLDDQGLPKDCDKIAEERIGAVMDDTQG